MNHMATVKQEKLISEAMKIARECDADYPRYTAFIMAMNTILEWMDSQEPTVWINQNNDSWMALSYEGPLKNKDYQQPFRDEHLCLLFSDTEKLTVEVKHCGYLFQVSACCPPTNPELHKSRLSDFEKDASSLTIAYTHGSDKCRLDEEKIKAISKHFNVQYPRLIICICG